MTIEALRQMRIVAEKGTSPNQRHVAGLVARLIESEMRMGNLPRTLDDIWV